MVFWLRKKFLWFSGSGIPMVFHSYGRNFRPAKPVGKFWSIFHVFVVLCAILMVFQVHTVIIFAPEFIFQQNISETIKKIEHISNHRNFCHLSNHWNFLRSWVFSETIGIFPNHGIFWNYNIRNQFVSNQRNLWSHRIVFKP